MLRQALVLGLVLTSGCGIGRSKLIGPGAQSPDASPGPQLPDAAPHADGPKQDALSPRDLGPGPDGWPTEVQAQPDAWPPVVPDARPDGPPPFFPDARPDGPPPFFPDARPDGPPPFFPDARPDGPPPFLPDARPDGPPPVTPDALPDRSPPAPDLLPDGRPSRPDSRPPPPECANGATCAADCTASCQVIGTLTCTCIDDRLTCGECQIPPIVVSPQPCPDHPQGMACEQAGLACLVSSGGTLSGGCLCATGGSAGALRWSCILP